MKGKKPCTTFACKGICTTNSIWNYFIEKGHINKNTWITAINRVKIQDSSKTINYEHIWVQISDNYNFCSSTMLIRCLNMYTLYYLYFQFIEPVFWLKFKTSRLTLGISTVYIFSVYGPSCFLYTSNTRIENQSIKVLQT